MSWSVLVAGAGALGSLYGAFLRRAGCAVTLLGRESHLQAIERDGLRVEGLWGEHAVSGFTLATAPRDVRSPFDLVLVAVKAYDTAAIAGGLAGRLAPRGCVLSLQNGLGNLETLAAVFGAERVLGAPVLIGATLGAPGVVRVTVYAKPVKIGAFDPRGVAAARSAEIAAMIDAAGVPSEPTERLLPSLWEKVLYNAALNPLGALLGLPYGALAEHERSRSLMDSILAEGFAVARAENVDLPWENADAYRRHFYDTLLPPTAGHRSSMLQDIERGRRTEIDALSGAIARRGAARGVAAPINRTVAALVQVLESNRSQHRVGKV